MSLAEHVRTLARGPGRARSLTQDEAQDAMMQMLSPGAAPEAIGAILMLLRMKGETAEEIAGFAAAAQARMGKLPHVDLDWSSYAAGRTRGAPWFLLSARLVARAGHRVLLHGWNGSDPAVRAGVQTLGIGIAPTANAVAGLLKTDRIAYLPLEQVHPALFHVLSLRDVLGLRSCVNTVCRMLNPARAGASVQGVFHPSYTQLQADAARLLGWRNLTVIKGGGGEFERNPTKPVSPFGLRLGAKWDSTLPPDHATPHRLGDVPARDLGAVWAGEDPGPIARDIILGTAALALDTLGDADPITTAQALWETRTARQAA